MDTFIKKLVLNQNRYIVSAAALLMASFLFFSAYSSLQDVQTLKVIQQTSHRNSQHKKSTQEPNINTTQEAVDKILAANLMGVTNAKTSMVKIESLPETKQELVLVGVFTEEKANKSSALIAKKGLPAQLYFIEDSLPYGGIVQSINAESVVINNNESLEVLYFPFHDSLQKNSSNRFTKRQNRDHLYQNTSAPTENIKSKLEKLREKRRKHAHN